MNRDAALLWTAGACIALALASRSSGVVMSTVRGLRNRNPGNLRANEFLGSMGVDGDGYAIFDTLERGTRGAAKQLRLYFNRGLTTVRSIVSTWAPNNENDTAAYIDAVCKSIGRTRDSTLQLTEDMHVALLRAIFRHELGAAAAATISDADILKAVRSI